MLDDRYVTYTIGVARPSRGGHVISTPRNVSLWGKIVNYFKRKRELMWCDFISQHPHWGDPPVRGAESGIVMDTLRQMIVYDENARPPPAMPWIVGMTALGASLRSTRGSPGVLWYVLVGLNLGWLVMYILDRIGRASFDPVGLLTDGPSRKYPRNRNEVCGYRVSSGM
jgi:hypothetical protein